MARVVLIGGNEWLKADGIDEYLAQNGGNLIDLLAYARDDPEDALAAATKRYQPLGVSLRLYDIMNLLVPPASLAKVAYMPGGHPDKLRSALNDSVLWQKLVDAVKSDQLILAGSSAGAMVPFEHMMAHGSRGHSGQTDLKITDGLGMFRGKTLIVPHWDSADKDWKLKLVDTYDEWQIIGIDENTAVVWEYGEAQVVGLGKVTVYDQLVRNQHVSGDKFKLNLNLSSAS